MKPPLAEEEGGFGAVGLEEVFFGGGEAGGSVGDGFPGVGEARGAGGALDAEEAGAGVLRDVAQDLLELGVEGGGGLAHHGNPSRSRSSGSG